MDLSTPQQFVITGWSQEQNPSYSQTYTFNCIIMEKTFETLSLQYVDISYQSNSRTYSQSYNYHSHSIKFTIDFYDDDNNSHELLIIRPNNYSSFNSSMSNNSKVITFQSLDEHCPLIFEIIHYGQYTNYANCYTFTIDRLLNVDTQLTNSIDNIHYFWGIDYNSQDVLTQTHSNTQFYVGPDPFNSNSISINIIPDEKGYITVYFNNNICIQSDPSVYNCVLYLEYGSNSLFIESYAQNSAQNSETYTYNIFRETGIDNIVIKNRNDSDNSIWVGHFQSNNSFYESSFHFQSYMLYFDVSASYMNSITYNHEAYYKQGDENEFNSNSIIELNCGENTIIVRHQAQYSGEYNCYTFHLRRQSNTHFGLQSAYYTIDGGNSLYISDFNDDATHEYNLPNIEYQSSNIQFYITPAEFGRYDWVTSSNSILLEGPQSKTFVLNAIAQDDSNSGQYTFHIVRNCNKEFEFKSVQIESVNSLYGSKADSDNPNSGYTNCELEINSGDMNTFFVKWDAHSIKFNWEMQSKAFLTILSDDIFNTHNCKNTFDVPQSNIESINYYDDGTPNSSVEFLLHQKTTLFTFISKSQFGNSSTQFNS